MLIFASRPLWIFVFALMLCPSVAPWAQTSGTPAAVSAEKLPLPPSSLQRRLAEHQQLLARQAARRAAVRKSRLRRLTGEGQSAHTNASGAAAETAGGTATMRLRQGGRAVMAAVAAAVAVSALTGDAAFLAEASGGTDVVSSSSSSASGTTSTSTSSN